MSSVKSATSIRLVSFDALYTLLTPRLPVYVQYAQTFEPYLGALQPAYIKVSFKKGETVCGVIFSAVSRHLADGGRSRSLLGSVSLK